MLLGPRYHASRPLQEGRGVWDGLIIRESPNYKRRKTGIGGSLEGRMETLQWKPGVEMPRLAASDSILIKHTHKNCMDKIKF